MESSQFNVKYKIIFLIQFIMKYTISVCRHIKTWKMKKLTYSNKKTKFIYYYKYKNKYPHAGSGKRIQSNET